MKMAEIKTIYKGESVTLLFTFPEAYNMARIASHKVFVGETEFTGVVEGQGIRMQLKSSDTDRMIGTHKIVCWIDDTTLGIRKPYCGELVVAKTQASGSTASVSNISDIIIPIVISETAITVGDVLYNYVKGDKGDPFLYSDFTPEQIAELKVKGDAFEYSDFTPEQIAELQKPASDIATTVSNAEQLRATAETNRNNAEGLRLSAEIIRNENEADRIKAEGLRASAETGRQTAEGLRQQAENKRQTDTAAAIFNAEKATDEAIEAAENVVDGKSVELQTTATHIQWRLVGDANWINLVALSVITGLNGKEVELQTSGGYIQWRLTGGTWANLVEINSLISAKENTANKQNSLTADGTGTKFPTVDAVNEGLGAKANKEQGAWITPTLLNGWINDSAIYTQIQYMKDDFGFVTIKGMAKSGTSNIIFTLPTGYRPSSYCFFSGTTNIASIVSVTNIYVDPDGNVFSYNTVQGTQILLSNIRFKVNQ